MRHEGGDGGVVPGGRVGGAHAGLQGVGQGDLGPPPSLARHTQAHSKAGYVAQYLQVNLETTALDVTQQPLANGDGPGAGSSTWWPESWSACRKSSTLVQLRLSLSLSFTSNTPPWALGGIPSSAESPHRITPQLLHHASFPLSMPALLGPKGTRTYWGGH